MAPKMHPVRHTRVTESKKGLVHADTKLFLRKKNLVDIFDVLIQPIERKDNEDKVY